MGLVGGGGVASSSDTSSIRLFSAAALVDGAGVNGGGCAFTRRFCNVGGGLGVNGGGTLRRGMFEFLDPGGLPLGRLTGSTLGVT